MGRIIFSAAVLCLLAAVPVWAANSSAGNSALALAAIVGGDSPMLHDFDKDTLAKLFAGNSSVSYPAGKTIAVTADKIVCRTSDVDITQHSCALTFGPHTRTITGRVAHELYATLLENGVPSDGAAGSLFEAVSQLSCTTDPNVVDQRSGGGATCNFTPGP
jgi:hypothetical protein